MSNNEDILRAIEKKIAGVQVEISALASEKAKIQNVIHGVNEQRQRTLLALAAGDAKASSLLDALDSEEKLHQRKLSGLDLLVAEKSAAINKLRAELEPVQKKVELEQFHSQAQKAAQDAEAAFQEFERSVERTAECLARFTILANRLNDLCGGKSEGIDYRNALVVRTESIKMLAFQKLANSGWTRPRPGALFVVPEVLVPAAFPPAAKSA